jgi:hypothetical protein
MANFTHVSNELAKKFVRAQNKKYALNKMIYDINYLVYSDTKDPLPYQAKSAIVKYIFEIMAGRKVLVLKDEEKLQPDFADVVIFFERRSFILRQLKGGIKRQQELN